MHDAIRIIAADPQPEMQKFYQIMLPQMGHTLVSMVETGYELIEHCKQLSPDLVISDASLLDMDAIDAAEQVVKQRPVPIIVLTAKQPPDLTHRDVLRDCLTFLIKPVSKARLSEEIPLAAGRFRDSQRVPDCGGG